MKLQERRGALLQVALHVSEYAGYDKLTRAMLADAAGVSESLVQYHFNTIEDLRTAILEAAQEAVFMPVLAQAMVRGVALPADLAEETVKYLAQRINSLLCPKCHNTVYMPSGSCSVCTVCGEQIGGC